MTEFNDLPFEERKRISYYKDQETIQTVNHILLVYDNDISPNLKAKLTKWKNFLQREFDKEFGDSN